jgi:pimeloyl-ACP methyl ester carboxylesterase
MNFAGFTEQTFITASGVSLHYGTNFTKDEAQKKQVVVLNYGLVCNVAHWKYQIPFLHEQGYNVVYHDYRFHFRSGRTPDISDLSFEKISQDMLELLDSLHVHSAVHLGHSMGVNTTLDFCRRHQEKVDGMVLISGTVLPPQDVLFDSNWMEIIQPVLEVLLDKYPKLYKNIWKTGHLNPLATHLVHRGGFNTKNVPIQFVEHYLKKIGELSPEVFFQLLKEMKNHDIVTRLESIQTPALIMGGDKDQVIPNFLQRILCYQLPHSKMYVIKDGSHVPQVDFADTVNERIKIFIEGLS